MKRILPIIFCGVFLSACGNSAQKKADEKQQTAKVEEQQKHTAEQLYQALQSGNTAQIKQNTTDKCYKLITTKEETLEQMMQIIPKQAYKEKILIASSSASVSENKEKQQGAALAFEYKYADKSVVYFVQFDGKQDFLKVDDIKLEERANP